MGKVRVWLFQARLDVEIESDRFDLTTECLMVTDTEGVLYGFPLASILYWTSTPGSSSGHESPADANYSGNELASGGRCTCEQVPSPAINDPDRTIRGELNPRCPAHANRHFSPGVPNHFAIDCHPNCTKFTRYP